MFYFLLNYDKICVILLSAYLLFLNGGKFYERNEFFYM